MPQPRGSRRPRLAGRVSRRIDIPTVLLAALSAVAAGEHLPDFLG